MTDLMPLCDKLQKNAPNSSSVGLYMCKCTSGGTAVLDVDIDTLSPSLLCNDFLFFFGFEKSISEIGA